jgi:hypothetical protein
LTTSAVAFGSTPTPAVPLHFVTPVWGAEYTQMFLDVALPTLLSPANIPAVPNLAQCVYRIYTTQSDETVIRRSDPYNRLSSLIPVVIVRIAKLSENRYLTSSECYRESLLAASREGAAVFTAVPDVAYADGGLASIIRLLRVGKRAVLVMGLRAVKETFVPELKSRFARDRCISVPPGELARLVVTYPHPITESHLHDGDTPDFHPSVVCWKVGDEGFLLHSFHLHPIAFRPPAGSTTFTGTIDDDLVQAAGFHDHEIHIVTDSDEFLCVEVSNRSKTVPTPPRRGSLEVVSWMIGATSTFHRSMVRRALRVHVGGTSDEAWRRAEAHARETVERLLSAYDRHTNPRQVDIPLHFVTPVWGEEYTRTFLEVTLPSLLSPGNIPTVPNLRDCVYRIYTTPADAKVIRASAVYARLRTLISVDIVYLYRLDENKYVTSSECYRTAMRDAAFEHSAAVYLIPDMIIADGGIRSVIQLLRAGRRAVLVMGLRALKESLVPEVVAGFSSQDHICIPPRQLVRLGTKHLHPIVDNHTYDREATPFHPSVICWKVGEEGFLLHAFHLHPVAVYPAESGESFHGTIDDDLIQNAKFAPHQIHVVSDSDELTWFEISSGNQSVPIPTNKRLDEVVAWMQGATSRFHREIVLTPIRVHSGELSAPGWAETEQRGREVIELFLSAHARATFGWRARIKRMLLSLEQRALTRVDRTQRQPNVSLEAHFTHLVAVGVLASLQVARAVHRRLRID